MQFSSTPRAAAVAAVADARRQVFWLDRPERPDPRPPLDADIRTDLLVVGGGFTGLWAALLAKQADPARDVVLVEGGRIAAGASGRNGGFVSASLTHGFANGMARWPEEMPALLRLGHENLDAIEKSIADWGIDCDFIRSGEMDVAVEAHQIEGLTDYATAATAMGEQVSLLDAAQARSILDSPTYLAAAVDRTGVALVDPARLAWGLRDACLAAGVRIHEGTPVLGLEGFPGGVRATCHAGRVDAVRAVLATNAYPPLLKRLAHYVVPVYDYALMTQPLSDRQWAAIGWSGREGVSDSGNQFHYYRSTADGRILWGGYDAVYHHGNGFGPQFDNDDHSYATLAEHFLQTFPQLEGIGFSHAWGGAIDTCSRFTAFWGTAFDGALGYVTGYTGLGVGASRFGAATTLDLIDGRDTERTRLEMVRRKPLPFPPEPLRSIGIGMTTAALQRADQNEGRRGLWLRALDRLGMGFDT